jgi:hypothetical protein
MENMLEVKLPLAYRPKHEIDRDLAQLKQHHHPHVIELGQVNPPEGHAEATPERRRHAVCYVLGPEEWNLLFPDIPSEYGGMICYRQ